MENLLNNNKSLTVYLTVLINPRMATPKAAPNATPKHNPIPM